MDVAVVAAAAVVAGVLGALGPQAVAGLPEPKDPDADKVSYRDLAARRDARLVMAVVAAAGAAVVAWGLDTPELVPAWVVVCGVGAWMGYVDWHTRYLPFALNAVLYPVTLLLVGLAALLLRDLDLLVRALVANVLVYLLFRVLYWVGRRWFGGGFGYGDVRLAGVLGLALGAVGADAVLIGIYASVGINFVIAVVAAVRLRRGFVGQTFAYGPGLLLGAVVGAVWGGPVG